MSLLQPCYSTLLPGPCDHMLSHGIISGHHKHQMIHYSCLPACLASQLLPCLQWQLWP
jgi:hypothetical protein